MVFLEWRPRALEHVCRRRGWHGEEPERQKRHTERCYGYSHVNLAQTAQCDRFEAPIPRYFVFDYFRTRWYVCVCRLLWLGTPNLLGAYVTCGKCALANSRRVFFYPGNLRGREIGRTRRKETREYRPTASRPATSGPVIQPPRVGISSWKGDDGFFSSIFFLRF